MEGAQRSQGALEGVRVLSFAQLAQGPAAVQLLADLGADVIQVEPPEKGAWERSWAGPGAFPGGESLFFLAFHRNQRSITLNLKHPKGRQVILRLVERSDVVVENFRPGVMERLGLGYEALRQRNPRLVYSSSTGFGPYGPYRDRPGQDLILQAESGLASITGRRHDPPTPAGVPIVDYHAAVLIAFGILCALYYRERTGQGQKVETSLLEAALHLQSEPLAFWLNGRWLGERSEEGLASTYHGAPYGIYRTKDGHMALSLVPLDRLASLLGLPELARFSPEDVFKKQDLVKRTVQRALLARTTREWMDLFLAQDVWCGAVNTYEQVEGHPQVQALGLLQSFPHPRAGPLRGVRHPLRFERTPPRFTRPPPLLGEHTEEVLREVGYSGAEIRKLREEGVI